MTAQDKRNLVAKKYDIIIGRNKYSQSLRDYCFKPYKDGKYYSDCSSSICLAYQEAGFSFGVLNTAGIYKSQKLTTVDVKISKGIPTDFSKLRVGDMLEFAGSDSSRPLKIGHVEMIHSFNPNGSITICGHGSNTPSYKDLVTYCKSRYNSWAPGGWRKELVCVKRYIQDDHTTPTYQSSTISTTKTGLSVTASSLNIRTAPNGSVTGNTYKKGEHVQVKAKSLINKDPWFQVDNGNWISAKYLTGWILERDGRWWYLLDGYKWHKNSIVKIGAYEYKFDNDGYMIVGWFKENGKWMYANADGVIIKSNWVKHTDGKYYYLDKDGYMTTNAYVKSKDKDLYYLLNSDGVWDESNDTSTPNLSKFCVVE